MLWSSTMCTFIHNKSMTIYSNVDEFLIALAMCGSHPIYKHPTWSLYCVIITKRISLEL